MVLYNNHAILNADIEEASLKLNGLRNCISSVEDELYYYNMRLERLEACEPSWNTTDELAYDSICDHINMLSDRRYNLECKEMHLRAFIDRLEEADKELRWFEICEEED